MFVFNYEGKSCTITLLSYEDTMLLKYVNAQQSFFFSTTKTFTIFLSLRFFFFSKAQDHEVPLNQRRTTEKPFNNILNSFLWVKCGSHSKKNMFELFAWAFLYHYRQSLVKTFLNEKKKISMMERAIRRILGLYLFYRESLGEEIIDNLREYWNHERKSLT